MLASNLPLDSEWSSGCQTFQRCSHMSIWSSILWIWIITWMWMSLGLLERDICRVDFTSHKRYIPSLRSQTWSLATNIVAASPSRIYLWWCFVCLNVQRERPTFNFVNWSTNSSHNIHPFQSVSHMHSAECTRWNAEMDVAMFPREKASYHGPSRDHVPVRNHQV